MRPPPGSAGTSAFVLVLIILTVAQHWPLLGRLASSVPSDLGDPLLTTWILWWNAHHVPFTAEYWNAPIFAPAPYAFALSETLLGLTWITSPLQWLGASPIVAYNLLFVATPVLNGLAAYWLCVTLTGRRDAAAIGGFAYAFAPYHAAQLAHIQTQSMYWMPVALAGLHKYWFTGQRRWLVCLGAATLMNGLTCGYFLLYFGVFLGLAVVWLTVASGSIRKLGAVVVTLGIAALPLAPVVLTYRFVKGLWSLGRPIHEIEGFSADVLGIAMASDRTVFWPLQSPGWLPLGNLYPQYPGVVIAGVLMVALVAAVRRRRQDAPASPWRTRVVGALVGVSTLLLLAVCARWIAGPWDLVLGPIRFSIDQIYKPMGLALNLLIVAAVLTPRFAALVKSGSVPGLYGTGAIVAMILALGPLGRLWGERIWYKPPFAWLLPLPASIPFACPRCSPP